MKEYSVNNIIITAGKAERRLSEGVDAAGDTSIIVPIHAPCISLTDVGNARVGVVQICCTLGLLDAPPSGVHRPCAGCTHIVIPLLSLRALYFPRQCCAFSMVYIVWHVSVVVIGSGAATVGSVTEVDRARRQGALIVISIARRVPYLRYVEKLTGSASSCVVRRVLGSLRAILGYAYVLVF